MIAERAFGQQLVGDDRAADAEVGVGVDREAVGAAKHPDAAAAECAGERELAHSFRQRHHGGEHHRGRAADEDIHAKRLAGAEGGGVMDADRAVDLIVEADFAVGLVLAARQLDAVHAEVRVSPAGLRDIFGVDLRQRDERAAVVGPAYLLRQLRDGGFVGRYIGGTYELRKRATARQAVRSHTVAGGGSRPLDRSSIR